MIPDNVKPGDFLLVHMGGQGGKAIHIAQMLNGNGIGHFEHAAVYVGNNPHSGTFDIVEARPNGAGLQNVHYYDTAETMWSSGLINLTNLQRHEVIKAAYGYVGVPYSWEDYTALALHRFHIPAPHLQTFIQTNKRMICSQLVDQCYQDADVQLFNDKRWPGYVTPGDLWQLLDRRIN